MTAEHYGTVLDLFAGPGGWDEGVRHLGLSPVGVEVDDLACATGRAAGHVREQADIASLPTSAFGFVDGLIASPPCQGFSLAGKGRGRADSALIIGAVAEMVAGRDPRDHLAADMQDPRSVLALEPLRWALDLRPEWMAWEQVPAVLPLWEACAEALRSDGYSAWAGYVNAEQYGVPQTRKRAVLIASRLREVGKPQVTHSKYHINDKTKLDVGVLPWVSMAEALDWPLGVAGFPRLADSGDVVTIDGTDYRARDLRSTDLPAQTVTEKVRSWSRWQYVNGNQAHSARRDVDLPAPTVHFSERMNLVTWQRRDLPEWCSTSPAPTVAGDPRLAPRGCKHPRPGCCSQWNGTPGLQFGPGTVRVSVEEAACLQSFPPGYPWQGSRTAQYRQVGDAVPPRLALHVIAEAIGVPVPAQVEEAA